ncbi:MAG: response regulator [Bryobacteraceae bacterium]
MESEKRYYQEMVASLPLPVAILDETLTIQASNRALRRTLWIESDKLRQAALDKVIPVQGLAAAAREVLAGRDRLHVRTVDVSTVAGVRRLRLTLLPFRGWDDEAAAELMLVAEDLTEAGIRAEEDHATARELYTQSAKDRAIRRFAGQVMHDCNNLLMILVGHGEELLVGLPAGSPQRDAVREILIASRRLARMTERLRSFTRRPPLEFGAFDLNTVVRKVASEYQLQLNHVEVELRLSPDLVAAFGDRAHIEDILRVLAARARDAMPEGGRLVFETAATELLEGAAETAGGIAPGDYAVVMVVDTGETMDRDAAERCFEPVLSDDRASRDLDVAYAVVREMGGDILVRPETGGGTRIRLFLPLASAAPAAAVEAAQPKGTVLVVDDEPGIRGLMRRVLQREGYLVLDAGDGESAVALSDAYEGAIDLLLTDVVMPHMGGRELADELRRRRPGLKVLYVSGFTGEATVPQPRTGGDVAFLQKPFTRESLIVKMRELLRKA